MTSFVIVYPKCFRGAVVFRFFPWNEVMIARQPKKTKGKFEHFVFHENAKSSAA
jgi:hypothetical protein